MYSYISDFLFDLPECVLASVAFIVELLDALRVSKDPTGWSEEGEEGRERKEGEGRGRDGGREREKREKRRKERENQTLLPVTYHLDPTLHYEIEDTCTYTRGLREREREKEKELTAEGGGGKN